MRTPENGLTVFLRGGGTMLTDAALKHLKPKDKNYKRTDAEQHVCVRAAVRDPHDHARWAQAFSCGNRTGSPNVHNFSMTGASSAKRRRPPWKKCA